MQDFEKYLNNFPVIPDVASKILAINEESGDYSFKQLDEMISVDPMLTSRILKVANSALYSRQKEITTLQMAIGLLGFKNIKSLVLLLTASQFSRKLKKDRFYDQFWKHSIVTAFIAREILSRKKDRANQELAFTLGLLHDIGKVALYVADPARYEEIMEISTAKIIPIEQVEKDKLKTDHMEVGARVMEHWNLPAIFSETAASHEESETSSPNGLLIGTVGLADILSERLGYAAGGNCPENRLVKTASAAGLGGGDLDYFLTAYSTVLLEDPLFLQCGELFFNGE